MLTRERERAGLTKLELSRRANLHPSRCSAIELQRATPPRDSVELLRLALALDYCGDPAELLHSVDETAPAEAATA